MTRHTSCVTGTRPGLGHAARAHAPRIAVLTTVLLLATAGAAAAKAPVVTVKGESVALREKILADGAGRTLYMFTSDKHGKSSCYGACAKAWPPLLAGTKSRALSGARAKLLGRTKRKDGSYQLTYRNHPLYVFKKDEKAGEVNGQGLHTFGGHWYVLSPAGAAIEAKLAVTNAAVTLSTRTVKGLGPVLVDSKGLTLYMFVPDKDKKVTCVSTCAAVWPPVFLPEGGHVAVTGQARASLVGSDPDPAGGRVVTYKGWPLYTYVADTKPGMTAGQALNLNGGLWYVLSPAGKVLKAKVRAGI